MLSSMHGTVSQCEAVAARLGGTPGGAGPGPGLQGPRGLGMPGLRLIT